MRKKKNTKSHLTGRDVLSITVGAAFMGIIILVFSVLFHPPSSLVEFNVIEVPSSAVKKVKKIEIEGKIYSDYIREDLSLVDIQETNSINVVFSDGSKMNYEIDDLQYQDLMNTRSLREELPYVGDEYVNVAAHKELEYVYKYVDMNGTETWKKKRTKSFVSQQNLVVGEELDLFSGVLKMKGTKLKETEHYVYKPESKWIKGQNRTFPPIEVKINYEYSRGSGKTRRIHNKIVLYKYRQRDGRLLR